MWGREIGSDYGDLGWTIGDDVWQRPRARCGRLCTGRTIQMHRDVPSQGWAAQGPHMSSLHKERAWFAFLGK